jgi:hypothetical protein
LALRGAGVALREALVPVQAQPGLEPAVVAADGGNSVVSRGRQLLLEVVGAGVDVVLDGVGADAVGVVLARDLHQAWGWPAGVGVAGGFLHGDEGEDGRVDAVGVAADLEVRVVLLAGGAGAGVEGGAVDVVDGGKVEEGRVPAVSGDASVESVLGSESCISCGGLRRVRHLRLTHWDRLLGSHLL